MTKRNKIFQILATILFVILLAGSALVSRMSGAPLGGSRGDNEHAALAKYGFYLQPVDNKTAGINFRHLCPDVDPKLAPIAPQIASMGAAVSIVDFDNDGWNDIYFTNSKTGSMNALYRNLHNGKFEDVSAEMGVGDVNKAGTGVSMGGVWGDFDNDGYEDLFLYKWGKPQLFHNVGGKKFVDVTAGSGLPDWVNANSAIWFDFDNDGKLDLFLGGYYDEKFDLSHLNTTKIMPESFRYANNGGRCYLLKNMGDGKFKDVTAEYGLSSTKWKLAAGAADLNGDGFPELYVANDYNTDELYINENGKKFVERGKLAGIGKIPKSGMSVAFGDINNSGMLGIYTTNITEPGILIQGNNYWQPKSSTGDPTFVNLAQLSGIENAGWSYGAQFGDLNNDGFMDIYAANGFISGKKNDSYWYDYSKVTGGNAAIIGDAKNWPAMNGKSQSGYEHNRVWINNSNGLFEDASPLVCPDITADGRSVAMADLWNRGVLDVVVANQNSTPFIYKNQLAGGNHWVDFDLHGTQSNASAIGARVELEWNGKKQVQIITGGIGFSSQNQHRVHFGIGKSTSAGRVIIHWPSGQIDTIEKPAIDQLHLITENKTKN